MGTYVISDIHGCYKEFLSMLDKVGFSEADQLILAGDYIDRGKNSYEMLKWMEHCPKNVQLVRGNHDEAFAVNINLMLQLDRKEGLKSDFSSNKDAIALYKSIKYFLKNGRNSTLYFDWYGTIRDLLKRSGVTLDDLSRWAVLVQQMPYYYELKVRDRVCIVVHAGYAEELEQIGALFSDLREFYLYARRESYQFGGKRHGMIIAGHTPTIAKDELTYNKGNVFRYYNEEKDCVFYDIDCGCVFRCWEPHAKLACIRLEDEKIFYV